MQPPISILGLFCVFFVSVPYANCQFAEIAQIATSLLGSGLGGGLAGAGSAANAAAGAGGAIAQIGQLYQLAQGALQLTGTGVGVLNQASEGNWFPAALEHAAKNAEAIRGGHGINMGVLGPRPQPTNIGPEFGTSFPAPNTEDYTDTEDRTPVSVPEPSPLPSPNTSVDFEDKDEDLTRPLGKEDSLRILPEIDESVQTELPPTTTAPRQIRIELPKRNNGIEDGIDYEDQIAKKEEEAGFIGNKDEDSNLLQPDRSAAAAKTVEIQKKKRVVPNLSHLIEVLRKSNLKEEEIMEIVNQVEGNENVEKPPKIDFSSGVQNIGEKKAENRERIVLASRKLSTHQSTDINNQVNQLRQIPDLSAVTIGPVSPTSQTPSPFIYHQSGPAGLHYSNQNANNVVPRAEAINQQSFNGNNRLQREIAPPSTAIQYQKTVPQTQQVFYPQQGSYQTNYYQQQRPLQHYPQYGYNNNYYNTQQQYYYPYQQPQQQQQQQQQQQPYFNQPQQRVQTATYPQPPLYQQGSAQIQPHQYLPEHPSARFVQNPVLPTVSGAAQRGVANFPLKSKNVGVTSRNEAQQQQHIFRQLRESSLRTTSAPPRRPFPTRTARTQPLTTPSPVRTSFGVANQPANNPNLLNSIHGNGSPLTVVSASSSSRAVRTAQPASPVQSSHVHQRIRLPPGIFAQGDLVANRDPEQFSIYQPIPYNPNNWNHYNQRTYITG